MRYDKSILEVIMSCSAKTRDDDIPSDAKLQAEKVPSKVSSALETDNKSNDTPPVPMIPDDDIDDGEEGLPLITSVFSLASDSSDAQKSSEKEATEATSSNDASPVVSVSTSVSPPVNGDTVSPRPLKVSSPSKPKPSVDTKAGPDRDNAPYYVGKGKLILPKPEENKPQGSLSTSTVAFSPMMSINPQTTTLTTNNTTNAANKESTSQTTGMMTRSAAHKMNSEKNQSASNGTNTATYKTQAVPASSTSQSHVVNLANTIQFLNVKSAQGQATLPALATHTSSVNANSVLSSASPLLKLIKSISPKNAVTTVNPAPATTIVSSTHAPLPTAVAVTPASVQVRSTRHINIAPAPALQQIVSPASVHTVNAGTVNTRYVVVPKTVASTSTIPATQVVSGKGVVNLPRVVMVPKAVNPQGTVPTTQVVYLIHENQGTGDGKTYRLLIPETSKVLQSAGTTTSQSQVTLVSSGNTVSPTQLVRIIPKPATTTVVNQNQKTQIPLVTQVISSPTVVKSNVSKVAPVLHTGKATVVQTEVTSQSSTDVPTDVTPPADESTSAPEASSSACSEEHKASVESLDAGLSPHEARIQKLKELLRKQEEAVDRLRQKRQKELDDVRAPSTDNSNSDSAASKRDSPFAVPLPPKKARLELYRSKLKETNTNVKDGFLPNTDDTQFVKLVGLEKVVDKLKAKKIKELAESHALDSEGSATL